jgi:hypothetical protein
MGTSSSLGQADKDWDRDYFGNADRAWSQMDSPKTSNAVALRVG